jgi:hypothetical protein
MGITMFTDWVYILIYNNFKIFSKFFILYIKTEEEFSENI